MKRWKEFWDRRIAKRLGIESWPEKEKELVFYVYAVLRNIEAIDFLPFVFGLIPVAWVYRGIESKIISGSAAPTGNYEGFWAAGCILLIYAATVIVINKLVVKKLQGKWISELNQKLVGDAEMAEAYIMLEILDSYPDWRISNTFDRLDNLF